MAIASMGCQQGFDGAGARLQRLTQVPSPTVPRAHDVTQGNGFSCQFGADGSAQKALMMKDADFGHISWVITNNDRLAHVGRQGEIKLTPCGRTFFLRHVSDTPPSSHL